MDQAWVLRTAARAATTPRTRWTTLGVGTTSCCSNSPTPIVVDQVFLDSIGADSDMSVWIGTKTDPFNNHLTLSNALLSSLFTEDNNTSASVTSRWANINAGNLSGNVLVIAASVSDTTPDDEFKISKVAFNCK